LSFAYSVPGIHWKGVAGMDLLTNMVGFGVLCPLSGWVLIRPVESAPWWFIGTIALFLGALYAPTTASDYAADRAFGIRTLAVRRRDVGMDTDSHCTCGKLKADEGSSLGPRRSQRRDHDAFGRGRAKGAALDPPGLGESECARGRVRSCRGRYWGRDYRSASSAARAAERRRAR